MDEFNMDESILEHSKWVAEAGGDAEGFIEWVNQVRAEAWEEGYAAARDDEHEHRPGLKNTNPYKEQP